MEALRSVRKFRRQLQIHCFSPPVMLATLAIELCLAAYVVWQYSFDRVIRLVVVMFFLLAMFQLAEYMVCGGLSVSASAWAKFGYVAITLLPPLGIHLAYALAGRRNMLVTSLGYSAAVGFIGYFLFASDVFAGSQCLGNYVIFQLGTTAVHAYTLYYYGLLLLAIGLSWRLSRKAKPRQKRALQAFMAGYMLFILPTTIVNSLNPATIAGIPSIMCGFAVLLALVVVFWVVPLAGKKRLSA